MKQKVIINCGSYTGSLINPLRIIFGNHRVHVFECNSCCYKHYEDMNNVVLHKKAVWTYDGIVNFYLQDNPLWDGHSICKEKKNNSEMDVKHKVKVECIDFSKWIKDNFSYNSELFLYMNIEGAEYSILDKMIKENTLSNFLYAKIYFHWNRYPNITTKEEHNRIIKTVSEIIPIVVLGEGEIVV